MKSCSLNDFLKELAPWLDKDHIRKVQWEDGGRLTVFFLDGMRNVYQIDDCSREQVLAALDGLKKRGIPLE